MFIFIPYLREMVIEHLQCGRSELRCDLSIKYMSFKNSTKKKPLNFYVDYLLQW